MPTTESVYEMTAIRQQAPHHNHSSDAHSPSQAANETSHSTVCNDEKVSIAVNDSASDDTVKMEPASMVDTEQEEGIPASDNNCYNVTINSVYNIGTEALIYCEISDDSQSAASDLATNPIYNSATAYDEGQIYSTILDDPVTENTSDFAANPLYNSSGSMDNMPGTNCKIHNIKSLENTDELDKNIEEVSYSNHTQTSINAAAEVIEKRPEQIDFESIYDIQFDSDGENTASDYSEEVLL